MYLPKSKYKGPFTASSGDKKVLVEETKEVYKGQYFITYKDELYEGRFPKEAGRKLIFEKTLLEKEEAAKQTKAPKAELIVPTEKDYENKKFKRYFSRDKRSGKIIEVGLKEFKNIKNYPSYTGVELEWWIEGPAQDTEYNGYLYEGAISRNKKAVAKANKTCLGIKDYLFTLDEFVL